MKPSKNHPWRNPGFSRVCLKCSDKKWYTVNDTTIIVCNACCKHDQGYWLLPNSGGYGKDGGKWACNLCGIKRSKKPASADYKGEIKLPQLPENANELNHHENDINPTTTT